jgi:Lar family restriction alleviation protein
MYLMSELLGLKPCPFCGQEEPGEMYPKRDTRGLFVQPLDKFFLVRCCGCLTEGPLVETKEEAIKAWNTRSPPT